MTKSKYLLLGALAAASLSPAAFALTGTTLDNIVGTPDEFFLSGATASDSAIKSFVKSDLCAAGTYDIYQDIVGSGTTAVKAGNWFTMTCTLNSAAPVPSSLFGHNVIIHKRTKIGSIYGVYPIALNSYVEFLNVRSDRGSGACVADTAANTYNCTVATSPSVLRDVPRHAGNGDECDYQTAAPANPASTGVAITVAAGLDTLCRRASMGSSDVEAEMFQGVNLTNFTGDNFTKLTSTQLGQLTRSRAFGQLFGVAVSNGVWTALQAAQGLTGAPAADGSNWPSLSRDTIRNIVKGNVATWSAAVAGAGVPSTIDQINVCRREQGSGSQASSNQFFLNYPCDTLLQPAQDNQATWAAGSPWVKENTSSTFVKACLNESEAGTTNAHVGVPGGGIGVLSFNGNPGASDTWKWVRINGVVPSMQNSILGLSDFWYETQLAYNKGLAAGPEKDLVTALIGEMSKATRITTAAANGIAAMSFTTGVGAFDSGTNNTAFGSIYTATSPVMGGKHGTASTYPTSGSPLSCRPILLDADTATAPSRAQ